MIHIRCTKQEQDNLLNRLMLSDRCLFEDDPNITCPTVPNLCDECMKKHIDWEIIDPERQSCYSLKCSYCDHESKNSFEYIAHEVSCDRRKR